jgi:hypothetical protein
MQLRLVSFVQIGLRKAVLSYKHKLSYIYLRNVKLSHFENKEYLGEFCIQCQGVHHL